MLPPAGAEGHVQVLTSIASLSESLSSWNDVWEQVIKGVKFLPVVP